MRHKSQLTFPFAHILIPLVITLPVVLALLPAGLPNTADGPVHFIRAAEMVHALQDWPEGFFLPRWSANLGYGYGIPLFVFAPPLPYLLTAVLHFLGLPLEIAMKGTLLIGVGLSGFGAYYLTRDLFGPLPGVVGAAVYLYAPIRLRELFIQGNAGQFMAWAFLPWACWGVIRLYQTGQRRYSLIIALAFTGTSLSHNIVAMILAAMLALLTIALFAGSRNWGRTSWVIFGGLLGLGLSAWFWLPALLESQYIQTSLIAASDFRTRFVSLKELIAPSPPLDTRAINPYFPLTLGVMPVVLALVGTVGLLLALLLNALSKEKVDPDNLDEAALASTLFFVGFTAFSIFMAVAPSEFIWSRLPFADLFEFPSRWHGFSVVGLGILSSLATRSFWAINKTAGYVTGAIFLLLTLGTALINLYPHNLPTDTLKSSPAAVVQFEVETGAVGTTSLGEFNPIWVTDSLRDSPLIAAYLNEQPIERLAPASLPLGTTASTEVTSTQEHRFHIRLFSPTTITIYLVYFPGWQAALNDDPVDIRPQEDSGLIELDLPAGDHILTLTFKETPLRLLANSISVTSWLIFSIGILFYVAFQQPNKIEDWYHDQRGTLITAALVIILIISLYYTVPDRFKLTSPPGQALPASTPLQVDFADQMRLLGVDLPPQTISAGYLLEVVAYWQALADLETDYAVFLHLDAPDGRTVATVDQFHPSEIPTTNWPATLYHRNDLRLDVPPDVPPIRYSLRLGLYDNKSGEALRLASDDTTAYEVGQIWVTSPSEASSDDMLAQFGESITLHDSYYDEAEQNITFLWQTAANIDTDYTIFVHLLDDDGNLLGQADGTPYGNQYPLSAWRVGQYIDDERSLAGAVGDTSSISQIAVGVYDANTDTRLAATDSTGQRLPNDALILNLADLR